MIAATVSRVPVSRRQFLAGAAALAGTALSPLRAFAMEPVRFVHGEFEVIPVSDGDLVLPASLHGLGVPEEERQAVLKAAGQGPDEFKGAATPTLIRKGDDIILFDVGCGPNLQPTAGKLIENLAAAGVTPDQVTKVVFSHGHPDHIWATVSADGKLLYPNAAYYAGATEWDFWNAGDILTKMPKDMHAMITETQRNFGGVKEKVTLLKPGDDVVTGIRAIDTKGHTPGHLSFEVEGGDGGLIILADVFTSAKVYFPHPEWKFGFDADHDQAVATRKQILDRAATDKVKLAGYHWAYPGLGYAERKDGAYVFVPAN